MSTTTAVLVEDDERTARGIAVALEHCGYRTSIAHDAESGLALVNSRSFDIAILDISLGNGTTSGAIANALVARHVPILFLTGMDEPQLPAFPPAAVVGFLSKPATRSALRTTLGLLRDHANAQRELAKVRQLLEDSQRIAQMGSFQVDHSTGEITWTDETYRLFGVTRESFTPTTENVLSLVHPEDREMIALALASAFPLESGTHQMEYSVIRPDGETRRLLGIVESDGCSRTPHVLVGTVQDVTERDRAAKEREAMERTVRVASEANRAKTEFLAQMSHELRTPLNAVLGLSEAMIERVFGDLDAAQIETLETIHRSGRHLLDLINDLLDIARVESGKLSIELEQATLRPIIDESTTLVANMLAARGQRLVIELAPAIPPVELDKKRMQQVLLNLLANASKFSPDGETITLRVTADPVSRDVRIEIADHGVGIAPEDLERIFDPFITIDAQTKHRARRPEGAGLGLSLAKHLVELHKGQLLVQSEVGRGSTFTIVLAMSDTYVHAPAPAPVTAQAQAQAGTVLVVEDNEATVLAVRTYLENRGFGVRVVGDGISALSAACDHDISLVLMDVQLPGLDGLEVTRRLRAVAMDKPIVALTAHAMPGDERRCLEAGASAYLPKPVRLRSLVETIDRLLERS